MKKTIAVALLAAFLAACASTPTEEGAPVEDRKPGTTAPTAKPPTTTAPVTVDPLKGDPLKDPSHPLYKTLSQRSIFFDFDSDAIKAEFVPIVEAHARFLRDNPSRRMLVQGNTDERGSREYNIGLGQRRSDAVKSRMVLLGAQASQIESVSLGEEKPRCAQSSDDCYAQNRRADILYQGE